MGALFCPAAHVTTILYFISSYALCILTVLSSLLLFKILINFKGILWNYSNTISHNVTVNNSWWEKTNDILDFKPRVFIEINFSIKWQKNKHDWFIIASCVQFFVCVISRVYTFKNVLILTRFIIIKCLI